MRNNSGFSLVGTIVGVAVFSIISFSIYGGLFRILNGIQVLRVKNLAINIANEQIEVARNLAYENVGIVNGLPVGVIPREQEKTIDGIDFNILASVRDVDDEYDGTIGGSPNDTFAADYKVVQFDINCINCSYDGTMNFFTRVAPKDLDSAGEGGALFINVINASGDPISAADVYVYNNEGESLVDIQELTDNLGQYKIVNAPASVESYQITVLKAGYSSERTYTVGDPDNPYPNDPHATVVTGDVTQITFTIDELSELGITTKDYLCNPVASTNLNIKGDKTIGYETYKVDSNLEVVNGETEFTDLEWDDYMISSADENYELIGIDKFLPINISPGTISQTELILGEAHNNSLLIQIKDSITDEYINDAEVTLIKDSFSTSTLTGFYEYIDENILVTATTGEYISEVIDFQSDINEIVFDWELNSTLVDSEDEGVKFQIAVNETADTSSTWDFVGPDGTSGTFYDDTNKNIEEQVTGSRYIKYKITANLENFGEAPNIGSISFLYNYECTPRGQAYFGDINTETYELQITKNGYSEYTLDEIVVPGGWQILDVEMIKN
jgi:type II secretory pathway pseudopilin PulG